MATQDSSPSLFIGQTWANWAEMITIADEDEEDKTDTKSDDSDSMKLDKKDMGLFGFCPSQDEFTLALCETCNLLVKPQALKRHIENRHGISNSQTTTSQSTAPSFFSPELAKTLSLPVTSFPPRTVNKPPTKASLKQVPGAVRMLGQDSMAGSSGDGSLRMGPSRSFRKASTNPVVNLERMPEQVAVVKKQINAGMTSDTLSPLSGLTVVTTAAAVTKVMSPDPQISCGSPGSAKLSLANGSHRITSGMSLSSLRSVTSLPVTTLATQPSALTTTTTNVMCTRPTPTTVPMTVSSASVTIFAKAAKPSCVPFAGNALVSTLSATTPSSSVFSAVTTVANSSGSKSSKKSPKERKFLPCKDREFDANKHCGVVMEDSGKPCTRSLTCKTHALGLRRAVPGRMKSFDELLREHKAAKDALIKAKAEEQTAAAARSAITSKDANLLVTSVTAGTFSALSSPAALAASAIKLGPAGTSSHRDIKSLGIISPAVLPRPIRSTRPTPAAAFQKFSPGSVFPPSLTVKEEPSPILDPSPQLFQSSDYEGDGVHEKSDITYLTHHPRPAAMCTFGARLAGGRCALFSRRTDLVRAAFLSALERQLNPPPHKKLCVESNLPKEPQMPSNSKDPYEFTMVDTTLGAQQCQNMSFSIGSAPICTSPSKPLLKHKAKAVTSPGLGFPVTSVTVSTSQIPTAITMPSFTAAMLKPSKAQDPLPGHRSSGVSTGSLSLSQTFHCQPAKRKRSGSNQGGVSPAHSSGSSTIQTQGHGLGLALPTGTSTGLTSVQQQPPQTAVLASVGTVNSHTASTPLTAITIPSVNLANAATLGLSATLPTCKQQHGTGQKTSIIKDLNFVLTSLDPSLVNGQYVNITGAQLAELAAAQAVSATAEDKNIKRSRLASTKHLGQKVTSTTLEALRTLQGSSVLTTVPPNAVLVDGSLQGAVLTPVSSLSNAVGSSSSNSAFVTLAASTVTASQSSTSITVTPTTIFRTVGDSGTPQQVKLTSALFANGIISSTDKGHAASSSHHHHHHHHHHQHQVGNTGSTTLARSSSGHSKTVAQGILQSPLCTGQALTTTQLAHLKPGTINFTKGVGGKLTMQPVSVTIPLVGQVGLSALGSTQQQGSHPQHTLLVTTAAEDGSSGSGGGKTEIHLQPQISSSPSGLLS
ncbi:ataxin-7-like protein 1 isoform X1 [Pomacea canaliculata]|uniref:ataxin-7-like protein 1 isoform X1 n=1 Tax=Pomacea canaliculata TaxID=400727 RepID=UPI000D7343D0|nr:ataxin-7-like protein 1 isoform X1 [Pomacea canaliculata]